MKYNTIFMCDTYTCMYSYDIKYNAAFLYNNKNWHAFWHVGTPS